MLLCHLALDRFYHTSSYIVSIFNLLSNYPCLLLPNGDRMTSKHMTNRSRATVQTVSQDSEKQGNLEPKLDEITLVRGGGIVNEGVVFSLCLILLYDKHCIQFSITCISCLWV